jgi:hypothetical protein
LPEAWNGERIDAMVTTPDPQSAIMRRIVSGQGTKDDLRQANANFQRWLRQEWNGDHGRSAAACVRALAVAYGPHWDAMPEQDRADHLWAFSMLCPPPADLELEALAYRDVVRSAPGGFSAFAERLRRI